MPGPDVDRVTGTPWVILSISHRSPLLPGIFSITEFRLDRPQSPDKCFVGAHLKRVSKRGYPVSLVNIFYSSLSYLSVVNNIVDSDSVTFRITDHRVFFSSMSSPLEGSSRMTRTGLPRNPLAIDRSLRLLGLGGGGVEKHMSMNETMKQ